MSFNTKVETARTTSPLKERSHSESPTKSSVFTSEPMGPDGHIVSSADIYSWKLKKEYDGSVFAVYCIHVALKCGFKWIVERRYTQFRELRKEINRVRPDLGKLPFPKKNWMFNLSKSALKHRQSLLNSFLSELIAVTPQLLEIAIFLEVEIRLANEKNEAKQPLRRSLSFGNLTPALSIKDFQLIKVLGKGRYAIILFRFFVFVILNFDLAIVLGKFIWCDHLEHHKVKSTQ